MRKTLLFTALLAVLCSFVPKKTAQPGDTVKDFRLLNVNGKYVSLKDYKDGKGFIVVFTCNHCPFAKRYEDRLNVLDKKYKPLGYPLIAISSSDVQLIKGDSYSEMIKKAEAKHFTFPYLLDSTQAVAMDFHADKTPHAFVLEKVNNSYVIRYTGGIDDNGAEPEKVTRHYVTEAVDALLAGRVVATPITKSIGCEIKLKKADQ